MMSVPMMMVERLFASLLLAVLSVTLLGGCDKPPPPAKPSVPAATVENESIVFPEGSPQLGGLRTTEAVAERESRVRINGRTAWDETATSRILSPLTGRIASVLVNAGSQVRKGQTLAVLAAPELGQTQADARRAESDLRLAERNLNRARELLQAGVIPLKEVQMLENEHERAKVERDRALARERLYANGTGGGAIDQQYRIVSPLDGVVVQRQVNVGQEVRSDQPSEQPLLTVTNPMRLWVLLDVPEALVREVQVGEKVRVSVPALPGESYDAKVDFVADFIDPQTRMVKARALLDNRQRHIKAEMYVTAEVEIPPVTALRVPASAVFVIGDAHHAFVEEAPRRFVRRRLKAEEGGLAAMRVLSGLEAGDKVVVDGALLLQQMLNQRATAPRPPSAANAKP